ncbi:MAG: CHASE domain-containing protein [Bdellovibrionota bacterium]
MNNTKSRKEFTLPSGAPILALVLGLTLTVLATFYIQQDVMSEESRRFHDLTSQIQEQIRLHLDRYEDTLMDARSFFAGSKNISQAEFHQFFVLSGAFTRAPGLRGVGYTVRVKEENLAEHLRKVRAQGFPNYSIWPESPRGEYFTNLYFEPLNWNHRSGFGFDMSTEPVRRAAMDAARDSGYATMSAKVTLLAGESEDQLPGFVLLLPLYRNNIVPLNVEERREKLTGFVYSPFRSQDLFGQVIPANASDENLVQFEVYDGSAQTPGPESLLYDSNGKIDFGNTVSPRWSAVLPISFNGHTWTIYVSSLPNLISRTSRFAAYFVAVTGLLFSLLAFWTLRSVKNRIEEESERLHEETAARKQVEVLANELRTAVRDRNYSLASLETINKVGRIISGELDLERLMQAVTDAATAITRAKFGAFFANQTAESGELYTLYTISGMPKEKFATFPMPSATKVFSPTFEGKAPVRSNDISLDSRYGKSAPYFGMPPGHLPVKSYLAVPVISRSGEVLGGLFFGHPQPAVFTERDEKSVLSLAAQAAVAVDNARLFKHAREAVEARDDFLSICSHELRTPLTSLKLQTQLTRRLLDRNDQEPLPPEKLRRFLDNTNLQIDRLVRLVEDMLDISRIRAGKLSLHYESVNLFVLVKEVVERFSPQLTLSGAAISLHLEEDVVGLCDRFRIEQVLVNLLTNAVKYGAGSPIEIHLTQNSGLAKLAVADCGIGIAGENQNRIFERFERAVSKHNISGLGLGLFIVRQIVEAHKGSITVESEIGKGARFTVTLPLESSSEPTVHRPELKPGVDLGQTPVSIDIQS